MPGNIRLWITIGILGLVIVFTLQNIVTVEVAFLFWTVNMPRAILVFVVFALGVLLGWILRRAERRSTRSG